MPSAGAVWFPWIPELRRQRACRGCAPGGSVPVSGGERRQRGEQLLGSLLGDPVARVGETRQLIGDVIDPAALDQLRTIGAVAPELLDAVIVHRDDSNAWAAERLAREPG
jgi:hypothetical protein